MKAGLATSLTLHAVVLGFGIVSLSSPQPMDVSAFESFPVDIVPVEEVSTSVQGERSAPVVERPAPTPTTREEIVEDATTIGDNTVDLQTPPTPDPRPRPVETAEAPPPAPEPAPPTPEPQPEPEPQREPDPQPVPTTEVAPKPVPPQEVAPDPAPETAVAEAPAEPEAPALPDRVAVPQARPQPPQAQAPRTPERREPERQPQRQPQQTASNERESERVEDQISALLNQDRASGGGAQRSSNEASLGGRQTTGAELSQSERDAIIAQLRSCWNVPVGAEESSELATRVRFRLDPSGTLEGAPVVEKASGNRNFDESTTRAIRICSQRGFQLPSDKYDTWAEVVVNFSPRDMF